LNQLPKVTLANTTNVSKRDGAWLLTTTLKNATSTPALMMRLNVTGSKDGQRILPVFFSDNYFSLLPNEEKTVTMKLFDIDTRGEKPKVEISGFNL
jgi:hypothetical protein